MLNKRGIFAIIGLLVLFGVVHTASKNPSLEPKTNGAILLGGFAYLLMTVSIWLSTRPRYAERFFGGLDRMYQLHKFCGIFAGLFVLVHFIGVPKTLPPGTDAAVNSLVPSAPMGMFALVILMLSLALALNRKIPYSKWKNPHKLMGLVYILASLHFFKAPEVFLNHDGPAIWMLKGAAIVGILSYFYSVLGMNRKTGQFFSIETVNHLERATEVVLKSKDGTINFQPGQFAFVEVQGKGWNEPHPFTISSGTDEKQLRFTVKVLGDWTRKVREELKAGQDVIIRGPYGCFDTSTAGSKQVWFAGGIGITPYLSMVRSMKPDDSRDVTLVYAVREKREALFVEELQEYADRLPNFNFVILESNNEEYARVDIMKTKLKGTLSEYTYFLCGPIPMVKGLMKDMKSEGVARSAIHTEAFEFR